MAEPFSDPWLAQRMHDRTAIHRAERDLHPAVRAAVHDYLRQATARVLAEQAPPLRFATRDDDPPDLQAFPDDSLWTRIVTGRIAATARRIFSRAFTRFARAERAAPPADDFTASLPAQLAGFPRRVWERLRTAVTEGLARGETPAQLRERVRALMTLEEWDGQVMTMTRTATMTALNAGAMAGALDEQARTGQPWGKTWQATRDERVRPSHLEADGQTRRLTETFEVGGHRFQFPGDPKAPPSESINCRCAMRLGPLDDPSLTASPTPQEAP